jgi:hypothetical protein
VSAGEYVATLYVEGGEHDGETFTVGTFATLSEAEAHAADLADLGQTDVYRLHPHANAARAEVQS